MKKTMKLTESDLHKVIEDSIKKVLNEAYIDFGEAGSVWDGNGDEDEHYVDDIADDIKPEIENIYRKLSMLTKFTERKPEQVKKAIQDIDMSFNNISVTWSRAKETLNKRLNLKKVKIVDNSTWMN